MITKKIHPLITGSALVIGGNLLASFGSYLFHLISGRLLTPAEYGLLESVIALLYLLTVFSQSLSFAVVDRLSRLSQEKVGGAIGGLGRKAILISMLVFMLLILLAPFWQNFLHFDNSIIYWLFAAQGLLSFLPVVYTAAAQARLKWFLFVALSVVPVYLKTLAALVLVKLGLGVNGAFGGFLVQSIITIILGYILIKRLWPDRIDSVEDNKNFWSFLGLSMLANVFLASLYSTDILFVRHFFDAEAVGIYSAGSVLSKMIFFGSNAVLLVAFPLFSKYKDKKNKLKKIYFSALFYILAVVGLGALVFYFFPNLMVTLLYGSGYKEAGVYLFSFAVFIGLAAVLTLIVQFLLALGDKRAFLLALGAATLQAVMIFLQHENLGQVLTKSIMALALFLVAGQLIIFKKLYERS